MTYVLALDQGTTSSRAILFNREGGIVGISQEELTQHYPKSGWVEHDANEIWNTQLSVAQRALADQQISADQVVGIGITNQRETTVIWDRVTGEPIAPAIVWQDRRTADDCRELQQQGHGPTVAAKTGLLIDSYFCATKIRWMLDHVPGSRERAERGELAFGTIDSWLIWRLTGGRVHATDVSNASRTMLYNLAQCTWDDELLELFDVPRGLLPDVFPSSHSFGETDPEWFGRALPIAGVAGDQQAALFGQNCTEPGMAKNTYGTGCFMLLNVGQQEVHSNHRLLTTMAATMDSRPIYALEGSVFIAGAVVQWLRDGLGIITSASEIEDVARSVPDSEGVYMVPAFAGLGAPRWDSYARGTIVGLTRGTNRGHLARAALEGIAFQVADVFDAMIQDMDQPLRELRVDGGACANNLLLQFQADIMGVSVVRPKVIETTALGAAYLAGLQLNYWQSTSEIASLWEVDRVFEPNMADAEVAERRARWNEAVKRAESWEQES